jgi:hypothetical protein
MLLAHLQFWRGYELTVRQVLRDVIEMHEENHGKLPKWIKAFISRRLVIPMLVILFGAPDLAMAIQCAYPSSDEDNSTYWWDTPGQNNTHSTSIDEDTTCAQTADAATINEDDGSTYRVILTSVTDPESSSSHTWWCTAYRSSNKANTLTIDLYQGATQINTTTTCSATVTNGTPAQQWPSGGCTLSGTEADSITNYADLRFYLTATGTSPTDVFVDSCALSVPDAVSEEMMVIGESDEKDPAVRAR